MENEDEKKSMIEILYKIKNFFLRMFTKCYWEAPGKDQEEISGYYTLKGCTGKSSMKYYNMNPEKYCQNCGRAVEEIKGI